MKIKYLLLSIPSLLVFTHLQAKENDKAKEPSESSNACISDARFWAEGEYLYWWIEDSPKTPPLVTQGPIRPRLAPELGQPGTKVVMGDKDIDNKPRSGGRFTIGYWFDRDQMYSTEIIYFFLARKSKRFHVFSSGCPGSPFLSFPFFDVTTCKESSTRISNPDPILENDFSGFAKLKVSNDLQGAEWNGLARVYRCCNVFDLSVLAGFRWLNFNEHLTFFTNSPFLINPDIFNTKDSFRTHNQFYGGQVGFEGKYCCHNFFVQAKGKVALGAMNERLNINGRLSTNDFNSTPGVGTPQCFPAGYLGMPTNNGHHSRTRFAVVPEVDVNFGYQFLKWLNAQVGYTFLYVSEVIYATNQIDRCINPSQAPGIGISPSTTVVGPRRPKPLFRTHDFWAQGINVGVEFRY